MSKIEGKVINVEIDNIQITTHAPSRTNRAIYFTNTVTNEWHLRNIRPNDNIIITSIEFNTHREMQSNNIPYVIVPYDIEDLLCQTFIACNIQEMNPIPERQHIKNINKQLHDFLKTDIMREFFTDEMIIAQTNIQYLMSLIITQYLNTSDTTVYSQLTQYKIFPNPEFSEIFKNIWINEEIRQLELLGLTSREISRLKRSCGSYRRIYTTLCTNPYTLYGKGLYSYKDKSRFYTCEMIDKITGRIPNSYDNPCATVVLNILDKVTDEAWMCTLESLHHIPKEYFELLSTQFGVIFETLDGQTYTYLKRQHECETNICEYINILLNMAPTLTNVFITSHPTLDATQLYAANMCLASNISIINGKPGTGKTSVALAICEKLVSIDISVLCTSFTGKIISRWRNLTYDLNSTNIKVCTMHKFIAAQKARIKRGDDNADTEYRPPEVVIIDEASMISEELMQQFFDVFGTNYSLILCGDVNQLPPLDYGSLFSELCKSNLPKCTLSKNYRSQDIVVQNLQRIQSHTSGTFKFEESYDFVLCPSVIENTDIVTKYFQCLARVDSETDIQVLCPYKKTRHISEAIQERLYPKAIERSFATSTGIKKFRVGARVVACINDSEQDVYNGDIGTIIKFDPIKPIIHIKFAENKLIQVRLRVPDTYSVEQKSTKSIIYKPQEDDIIIIKHHPNAKMNDPKNKRGKILTCNSESVMVDFGNGDIQHILITLLKYIQDDELDTHNILTINEIELCYVMTVHKCQGSEYRCIIFYVPKTRLNKDGKESGVHASPQFLNKNLTYTAISRSKQYCYICGNIKAITNSIQYPVYRVENLYLRMKPKFTITNIEYQTITYTVYIPKLRQELKVYVKEQCKSYWVHTINSIDDILVIDAEGGILRVALIAGKWQMIKIQCQHTIQFLSD